MRSLGRIGESHWLRKAIWVWQEANGPVPKGRAVVQLDGDPENCELSNLDCVRRAVLAILNHHTAPRYAGKDLNPARVRLAQAKMALSKRRKGETDGSEVRYTDVAESSRDDSFDPGGR